jgi:lipoic acid synthetase
MEEASEAGVDIFTIGQYLQPTKKHLPVNRYVEDSEFLKYKKIGNELGFLITKSGSLVRSSYRAEEGVKELLSS